MIKDKFYRNLWVFFLLAVIISCFLMDGLFILNNNAQNSDKISLEEREAIEGITYHFWNEFKILIPTMIFLLLISYWISSHFAKGLNDGEKGE